MTRLHWLLALAAALPCSFATAPAQGRALTHDDYDDWKSLRDNAYSVDGNWVAYQVRPQWGDPVLEIRHTTADTVFRHERGADPAFSSDSRFVAFLVEPSVEAKRAKEIAELREKEAAEARGEEPPKKKGKKDDEPKKALAVLDLSTGEVEVVERVKRFSMADEQPFLAYHLEAPKKPEKDEDDDETEKEGAEKEGAEGAAKPAEGEKAESKEAKEKGKGKDEGPKKKKPERAEGTTLVVRDLTSGAETRHEFVARYGLTDKGTWLWMHCSSKDEDDDVAWGVHALRLATGNRVTLVEGPGDYTGFTSDDEETGLAFTSNVADFVPKHPKYDLYLWDMTDAPARIVASSRGDRLPDGKVVAQDGLRFCDDGSVLTFGIRDPEQDTPAVLDEEKVVLDLWHWQDGLIQPMQAKRRGDLDNPAWTCVYHRTEDRVVVLGDEDVPSVQVFAPDGSRGLANDSNPYLQRISWDARYSDVYLVNTIDGKRTKVLSEHRGWVRPSTAGRYVLYFDEQGDWHGIDVVSGKHRNLTGALPVSFADREDDHPHPDPAHGIAGWTEDDREVLLYDRYDVWRVDPATGEATCVTDGFGRANQIRLRVLDLEPDVDEVTDPLLLTAFDENTIEEGIYRDALHALQKPTRVTWMAKNIGRITKAEDADRLFFTLETFREFPDLWTAKPDFTGMRRLSHANPQQDEFRWGTAELVKWRSHDGTPLKGYLVKPDGFDPSRKYPMMVYFYERMSQRMNSYSAPSPGTSPNPAYYVSNGYLWFVPDIVYDVGYPGDSAVKCVVSGVQSIVARGFVDEDAIGAAGHSWGGYQTAYLVTRTAIFKAVESGAPVSNMISAYGGIRYGSGMSRQFQYEMTQSRIGGSLWEYPLRYWENSPVFFADKVTTPVLILHNDDDGAVPWTNGIEYFMALRRLGVESYLFNYNGEAHGLRKRQNQKDWTRRMAEYFAHHLKGAPAPDWMREGVPHHERMEEKLQWAESLREMAAPAAAPANAAASAEASASGTR